MSRQLDRVLAVGIGARATLLLALLVAAVIVDCGSAKAIDDAELPFAVGGGGGGGGGDAAMSTQVDELRRAYERARRQSDDLEATLRAIQDARRLQL